jgi:transcriptional regulator with XRE-family HTH domain
MPSRRPSRSSAAQAAAPKPRAAAVTELPLPALGRRLRYFRRIKQMTLNELAEAAGCSGSLLSRVENDLVTPSLTTLHRLCTALGISVAALMAEAEERPCVVFAPGERPNQGRVEAIEGDGSVAESLVPPANSRQLEGFVITLAANRRMCGPFEHEGEEVGFVLEGELHLIVDGQSYAIKQGGSFFFRSDLPHSYGAKGRQNCRVIWINTPPTF